MKFLDKKKNFTMIPAFSISIVSSVVLAFFFVIVSVLILGIDVANYKGIIFWPIISLVVYWLLRTHWANRWAKAIFISLLSISILCVVILGFVISRINF